MAPDAAGVMRKIPDDVRVDPGRALARFGDGGWWPSIDRGLQAGEFSDDVIEAVADLAPRPASIGLRLCRPCGMARRSTGLGTASPLLSPRRT